MFLDSLTGKVPCRGILEKNNVWGTEWELGQLMFENFPRLFMLHGMEESSELTFLWKALYMVQKKSHPLTGHVTLHA